MSRSGKSRVSKWDTKEEHLRDAPHVFRRRKPGESISNRKSQARKLSPQIGGDIDSKRNAVDSSNKGDTEFPDATLAWNRDGSCSVKMSPGLEDWRQQYHSRSPRTGCGRSYGSRSRSRSRSPPGGFKRESGLHGRNYTARTCRDFAGGRCRRGDHCRYLHQVDREYEDRRCTDEGLANSWKGRHRMDDRKEYLQSMARSNDLCSDFIKGKCHEGKSCRFVHDNVATGKDSGKDLLLGKEKVGSRYAHFDHSRVQEPHKGGDIPCIYFAAGNCRKGKFCRFSHHGKTDNPHDRSQDDGRRPSSDADVAGQMGEHPRRRGTIPSDNAKLLEWDQDKNDKVGNQKQREAPYPRDGRWVGSVNVENRSLGHPPNNGRAVDCKNSEHLQPNNKTSTFLSGFESNGAESWFADMEVSSPWNSKQYPGHVKDESGQISQTTLPSFRMYERDMTGEMLGQKHQAIAATPSMISEIAFFPSYHVSREDAGSSFATSDCPLSNIDPKYSAMDQNGHCSSEYFQPKDETISSLVGCQVKGAEYWFGDMEVSSPWNPGQLSSHFKQESGQITQTAQSVVPNVPYLQMRQVITGERLDQKHQVIETMPPMIAESAYFQLKPSSKEDPGSISSDCPNSSTYPGGQNQHALPLYDPRGETNITAQNRPLFEDEKTLGKPDAANGSKSGPITEILSTQNILSREQLSQFANLSVLSQLLGNANQLSLLGSDPNPLKSVTLVSPNSISGSERQYDPLIDSIESVQCHNPRLGGLLPSPSEGKVVASNQQELPSKDLLSSPTVEVNNGPAVEESKKAQENGSLENVNGDGRVDEGKKKNNGKAIRAFKFALAEFVKEILKPKWKEGEINRDSYKAIVKKVVDKVTGSLQGAHIPQSQEKIDNYLTSSELKVTKLVEAYVEKQQKT